MKTHREPTAVQIGDHDLNAFVDGVLDDDRRVDLLAHLAANPADAEKVNGYFRQQAMFDELRDALSADDDDRFLPDLQRGIDRAMTRQRLFVVGQRLAAAVALLVPAAAAGWWMIQAPDDQLTVAIASTETGQIQIADVPAFPFGGSFAPIELRAIDEGTASLGVLAHYLDSRSLKVPDLGALGLKLIGGESLSGVELPAARLIYMDERGNRLQVYIAVVEGKGKQAVTVVPEGHLSLNWRSGPLVFAVVGPAGATKLLDVMRSVSNEMTAVAEAPPTEMLPASGGMLQGSVESEVQAVQPVAMPDAEAAVETKGPALLPTDKVTTDPEVPPVNLEATQPKV